MGVGPMLLRMSYFEVTKLRRDLKMKSKLLMETKSMNLHEQDYGVIPMQNGEGKLCNYVIVDTTLKKFHFYSRFINASNLCRNEKFSPTSIDIDKNGKSQ